jgi:hypothetical protein
MILKNPLDINCMELDLDRFIITKEVLTTYVVRVVKTLHTNNLGEEFIFVIEHFINKKLIETNINEWIKYDMEGGERDSGHLCICSHDIYNLCEIWYLPLDIKFQVGNCCVKKNLPKLYLKTLKCKNNKNKVIKELKKFFNIRPKIYFIDEEIREEDKINKDIMLEELENLFKPKLVFSEEEYLTEKNNIIRRIGNYRVFFGKYKNMRYKELIEIDKNYCKYILTFKDDNYNIDIKKYIRFKLEEKK